MELKDAHVPGARFNPAISRFGIIAGATASRVRTMTRLVHRPSGQVIGDHPDHVVTAKPPTLGHCETDPSC